MTVDSARKRMVSLLDLPELADCLDRWISSEGKSGVVAVHQRLKKQLAASRFVVPVSGIQGAGKSTLVNALLFEKPVLPVDADETTAVPIEIHYAVEPNSQAIVHFKDGRVTTTPATESGLRVFVHQEHNPGNNLGVDRIVVESRSPLLATGLVIVDLPGMGSLTTANAETTKRYLEEAVGVTFLLRTMPPLTRSESLFVVTTWSRLPTAFFVQNRWTDESDDEMRQAHAHNAVVLRDLARRAHIDACDPPLHVVNAYNAWKARLTKDLSGEQTSGLAAFRDALATECANWKETVVIGVQKCLTEQISLALARSRQRVDDLKNDRSKVEKEIAEEQKRFDAYINDLKDRCSQSKDDLRNLQQSTEKMLREWEKTTRSDLRNEMRTKMRAGITDGPRLSRALRDEQSAPLDNVCSKHHEALLAFRDQIQERFAGVVEWERTPVQTLRTVHVSENTKYENLATPVLGATAGISGGLGGAWGGGVAGVKLGALLGTPLGPAGNIVGGLVGGVIGGLFGAWVGGKVKATVTNYRADNVEPLVFAAIDQFTSDTRQELLKQFVAMSTSSQSVLDRWLSGEQLKYQNECKKRLASIEQSNDERADQVGGVNKDIAALEKWLQELMEDHA